MANISSTIKVDMFVMLNVVERILLGANCSPEEIYAYKALFSKNFVMFFPGHM
jgi:hypothetical protein